MSRARFDNALIAQSRAGASMTASRRLTWLLVFWITFAFAILARACLESMP